MFQKSKFLFLSLTTFALPLVVSACSDFNVEKEKPQLKNDSAPLEQNFDPNPSSNDSYSEQKPELSPQKPREEYDSGALIDNQNPNTNSNPVSNFFNEPKPETNEQDPAQEPDNSDSTLKIVDGWKVKKGDTYKAQEAYADDDLDKLKPNYNFKVTKQAEGIGFLSNYVIALGDETKMIKKSKGSNRSLEASQKHDYVLKTRKYIGTLDMPKYIWDEKWPPKQEAPDGFYQAELDKNDPYEVLETIINKDSSLLDYEKNGMISRLEEYKTPKFYYTEFSNRTQPLDFIDLELREAVLIGELNKKEIKVLATYLDLLKLLVNNETINDNEKTLKEQLKAKVSSAVAKFSEAAEEFLDWKNLDGYKSVNNFGYDLKLFPGNNRSRSVDFERFYRWVIQQYNDFIIPYFKEVDERNHAVFSDERKYNYILKYLGVSLDTNLDEAESQKRFQKWVELYSKYNWNFKEEDEEASE